MMPILGVVLSIFSPSENGFTYLVETVLPSYVASTLALSFGVALGVFGIGVSTAWLVAMCDFPGRRLFDWALILPLAVPAYVIAYAYTDFLQHSGPVQSILRDLMGWGPRDYWFPNIRSLPGAILMFSLVFYPYVYLLARSAFMEQSTRPLEASRTLGATPWQSFYRVALPLARPSIAAGVALALMETLADYGAVAHFGIPTFTTGIYRAWFSFGDRILAAQLATGLLAFILLLLALERQGRGRSESRGTRQSFDQPKKAKLTRVQGLAAFSVCALPVFLGFVLPALLLIAMAIGHGHSMLDTKYLRLAWNSFSLAGITAAQATLFLGPS
jgi:iron(III) transport system permease protein